MFKINKKLDHLQSAVIFNINKGSLVFSYSTSLLFSDPMEWQDRVVNLTQGIITWVSEYVDIDFVIFIKWLMSPIILTFCILPL